MDLYTNSPIKTLVAQVEHRPTVHVNPRLLNDLEQQAQLDNNRVTGAI
jgi:hypothetical protein